MEKINKASMFLICFALMMVCLPFLPDSAAMAAEKGQSAGILAERSVSVCEIKNIDLPDGEKCLEGFLKQQALDSAAKKTRGSRLKGNNAIIYDKLKEDIKNVASGKTSRATFTVKLSDLEGEPPVYTAKDLGVDNIVEDGNISNEVLSAFENKYKSENNIFNDEDNELIQNALIADLPYDLYWFDKKNGIMTNTLFEYTADPDEDGNYKTLTFDKDKTSIEFTYTISKDYSSTNEEGTVQTDKEKIAAANTAAENASGIVDSCREETDFEKLRAYKNKICALTSYGDFDEETPYGNLWQMINVFDGKDETKVVCEGYAKAFQFLCDISDFSSSEIESHIVDGKMILKNTEEDHMWNILHMSDGKNYLIDITNSDRNDIDENSFFMIGHLSGDPKNGYKFRCEDGEAGYRYSDSSFNLYDDSELMISDVCYEHNWRDTIEKDPTCTEKGIQDSRCIACDAKKPDSEKEIPAKEHRFIKWVIEKEATCTENGIKAIHCIACDVKKPDSEREIPAKGHIFGDWSIVRDIKERVCSECGKKEQESIPIVERVSLAGASVTNVVDKVYTGRAQRQNPVVKADSKVLKEGTDYTISYLKNIAVGQAEFVITGCSGYSGRVVKRFVIRPESAAIKKPAAKKKAITVRWKIQKAKMPNARISGYQVQCAKNKAFSKGLKKATVKGYKKSSVKIAGLRKKSKYFVRVRTYMNSGGMTYCSKWSAVKNVRTK